MHQLADDEHIVIFLFGNEGQLTLLELAVQHHRVQMGQVVAHQQEAPLCGGFLQSLGVYLHPQDGINGLNVQIGYFSEKGVVMLLRDGRVNAAGDEP